MSRLLDLVLSGTLLLVLSPLFLCAGLAVKISLGSPVFFRQERVGRGGRVFTILKFRTMRPSAPGGRMITVAGDSRVTPTGALLRRTKIDELPQLLNVLLGDMALVGPRPEVARYVAHYTPEEREVLRVRPGITDKASLEFIDEESVLAAADDPEREYIDVVMRKKLAINLEYLAQRSLWTDMRLICETALRVAVRAVHAACKL